eukprot:2744245-Amphidinium_carterae.1
MRFAAAEFGIGLGFVLASFRRIVSSVTCSERNIWPLQPSKLMCKQRSKKAAHAHRHGAHNIGHFGLTLASCGHHNAEVRPP